MPVTLSDYLLRYPGVPAVYVQAINNSTTTAYVSATPSDGQGLFTLTGVPAGTYTLNFGPTNTGPWTATGDTNYVIADPAASGGSDPLKANLASPTFTGVVVAPVANVASAAFAGKPHIDVTHPTYGADPTGAADSTTAIQAAINALPAAGGTVLFPGTFKISASLVPKAHTRFLGTQGYSNQVAPAAASQLNGPAMTTPMIDPGATNFPGVMIEHLSFNGSGLGGSKAIYAATADDWTVRDCFLNNFGEQALHTVAGVGGTFEHIFSQNSVQIRTGRGSLIGGVDIGCTDFFADKIVSTASNVVGDGLGNICGILIRGSNGFMTNCIGHFSQIGIGIGPLAYNLRSVANRGDFNLGPGWQINSGGGYTSEYIACDAYKNSQRLDNESSGFVVTDGGNKFVACTVDGLAGDAIKQKNGFDDSSNAGNYGNQYTSCYAGYIRGVLLNQTGTSLTGAVNFEGRKLVVGRGLNGNGPLEVTGLITADLGINVTGGPTTLSNTTTIGGSGGVINAASGALGVNYNSGSHVLFYGGGAGIVAEISNTGGIGLYGHAVPAQPAAPVTLADVIAIIRGCGLSA